MLTLKRKVLERIVLTMADGRQITFKLLETRPGVAKVGIDAPPDVLIEREEISFRCPPDRPYVPRKQRGQS